MNKNKYENIANVFSKIRNLLKEFIEAVKEDDFNKAKSLIDLGINPYLSQYEYLEEPLFLAIENKSYNIAKLIIESKYEISDSTYINAFSTACYMANVDTINLFLNHDKLLEQKHFNHQLEVSFNNNDVLKLLLTNEVIKNNIKKNLDTFDNQILEKIKKLNIETNLESF